MYDPKAQALAQARAGTAGQEQHQPDPSADPYGPNRPGWRKQVMRAARFTVKEALRSISSGLGSIAVTAVILWWQSRH